ncbi:MAG: AsmA-like C-terminal region-containing protein [Limisphaerales bacterium]
MLYDMRPGFWGKCRAVFCWLRVSALLLLLAAAGALLWFNQIGLPDFLKRPLVEKFRARGFELEFSRLHLSFVSGLIADKVRVGDEKISGHPSLSLQRVQLHLNFRALLHGRFQLTGLALNHGDLTWPVSPTNALALQNIQTELRFQTNGGLSLDNFYADFAGAKLALSGDIAHAPELRNWKIFHHRKKPAARAALQNKLQTFSDTLSKIHFEGTPQLSLIVNGDADNIHSFSIRLNVRAPGAKTPWFNGDAIQLVAKLTAPANVPTNFDSSWDFWTNAQPFQLVWFARLGKFQSKKLSADLVFCAGFWRAPEFAITNLSADLGGGQLNASTKLNVATRELTFTNASDCDLHAFDNLLTKKTSARLADFSWTQPPALRARGSLILPAWTNRKPDWNGEVRPTVRLNGELAFTNAKVRGVAIDSARAHFSYSNLVWRLPDFRIARKKTELALDGDENDRTKVYDWHIRGAFDAEMIRPFLTKTNAIHEFSHLTFAEPLALDVTVRGRLYDYGSIGVSGRAALTNFSVRAQSVDSMAGELFYTNRVLEFLHPHLSRDNGAQTMTADSVTLNFNERRIYFTNGLSTADPEAVGRAIGKKLGHILEPYHFLQPPVARVNGVSPMHAVHGIRDVEDADLRFNILQPVPFQWLKLKTPGIEGTIHWLGATLILTNVTAEVYGGSGNGFADFDFRPAHEGADYQFTAAVTNVNLHLLAKDFSPRTNNLEGVLSGKLVVTDADTRNLESWNGHGRAAVRDGLLWEIPIFGILSPVLNTVSPGLGSSRATGATMRFTITNGVIFSDTLEIHATLMQLQYAGTVDLKQNVNARVTAQLLRNTPVIGPIISTLFTPMTKLFEYRVTGTLKHPKAEPVYVPSFLLMPLHPIRTLEELFPGGGTPTNAPAEK